MQPVKFPKNKTFIIAEAGVNHNGNIDLAKQLIDVAVDAGADAVKFQCFQAEDLVAAHAPKADYQMQNDAYVTQLEMLRALELSYEAQKELLVYCNQKNILFLSSPFDEKGVSFLAETLNLPIIKIPSGEITNVPLLLKLARTQKPVILSTGMSTIGDIEEALAVLAFGYLSSTDFNASYQEIYYSEEGQAILREKVSLLHCTSEYPAPYEQVNLHAMQTLQQAFQLPTGYSDHTLGIAVAIAAVACGATIIEKHFTLDTTLPGPDHKASLMPHELMNMVTSIRQVEKALGSFKKLPVKSEIKTRAIARKSLVALREIKVGECFTHENLGCKRPGSGIPPKYFYEYQNTYAEQEYQKDDLIGVK